MSFRNGSSGSATPPPLPGTTSGTTFGSASRSAPPRFATVIAPLPRAQTPAPVAPPYAARSPAPVTSSYAARSAAVTAPYAVPAVAAPVTASVTSSVTASVTASIAAVAPAPAPSAASLEMLDEREHAIEVAAMLGDSVVAIKHCALPPKQRQLAARWWFAIAGAGGLVALIAFALTLRVAAHNDDGMRDWVKSGRPVHAFRPQLLGGGYDAAGFAGLGVALAAATLGLLRLRQGRMHPLFRIGTDAGVELPVADAPMPSFPVVSTRGDRLVVRATAALAGELVVDGVITPVGELTAQGRARQLGDGSCELQLPVRGRLRLRCGSATLLLSAVPRPAQQLPVRAGGLDQRVLAYVAGALAVHLVALALIRLVPEDATVASADLPTDEEIRGRLTGVTQDDKVKELERGVAGAQASGTNSSAAMALPAGAAGDPSKAPAQNRLSIKRTSDDPQIARQQAVAEAARSGLLGSRLMREANFQAITGSANLSSGLDEATFQGGYYGDEVGGAYGKFGGAPDGDGPGGGGDDGIIGDGGKYHTIGTFPPGRGLRIGTCRGVTGCNGTLPDRGEFRPEVKFTEPRCTGENGSCGLDKAIIRRYIKRSIDKIRYCYEKELLAQPTLAGTVMSSFVISPKGSVLDSSANGVDGKVSSCVASVVGGIAFPPPGSAVQVNYPFVFRNNSR